MSVRTILCFGAAALVAVGCGNPTKPAATSPVVLDTLVAYSINNAPQPQSLSAFYLAFQSLVVPDGTLAFDFAFDLTPSGKVILLPAATIGTVLGTPLTVGYQKSTTPFETINGAPNTGYVFNQPDTVAVGQAFLIISRNPTFCSLVTITSQQALFGKFVIDSVNQTTGQIFFRTAVDPNCDYDTLIPGVIPTH
jgi:hypothetical protein